ncbi:MAG: acyl-CoA dehydrogenase family protein [Streptosporangiaceae bacterium]
METTLTRVHDISPVIAKRSEEIEQARRVPADLLDMLLQAGCLRMGTPAGHGGDDLPLPAVLRVIEALAEADGSVSWIVGQAFIAQVIFGYFPAATVDEIYAARPDIIGAGAVAPKGRAVRQRDGWRITGQWPFASGCLDASWIYLQCLVASESGEPCMRPDGIPEFRMAIFPARKIRILDTWHVMGLRGTGSHDVRVTRGHCPNDRACAFTAEPSPSGSLRLRIHGRDQGGLVIAATALGIARGALDELAQLAGTKRPAFSRQRLSESPVFQDRLGEAHMTLRAARALLYAEAESAWATTVMRGEPLTALERGAIRAVGPAVVSLAVQVTDTAHKLAGGSAIYEGAALQRRLRDVHTASAHFSAGRTFYEAVGALLAGQPSGESLL